MEEPLTEELLDELLDAPDPAAFADKHAFEQRDLASYLTCLLEEKGLKRSEVVRAAGLDATFGYQIFKGRARPRATRFCSLPSRCRARCAKRIACSRPPGITSFTVKIAATQSLSSA